MNKIIPVICVLFLFGACIEDDQPQETFEDFKNNHYDLTLTKKETFGKISYTIAENFVNNYSTQFVIKSNSRTRFCAPLGIHFSVERFTESDKYRDFMEDVVVESNLLNAFHDAYIYKRYTSLDNGSISIKKETPHFIKFKGVAQVCSGEADYSSDVLYYATTTLQIGKEYYVFQFISNKEMMDVAYDDFERILASVRKIK